MRHRIGIASLTGFGNPSPALLKNQLTGDKILDNNVKCMLKEAINMFPLMKKYEGCDFEIEESRVSFGIEPAYMYEHLEIVCVNQSKGLSYIREGYAHGIYGSDIVLRTKYYENYKYQSKFVKFIDKWHKILFYKKI